MYVLDVLIPYAMMDCYVLVYCYALVYCYVYISYLFVENVGK